MKVGELRNYITTREGEKRCPRCKRFRKTEEFAPRSSRADGLAPYCRDCTRKYNRARWIKSLPEKVITSISETRKGDVIGEITFLEQVETPKGIRWKCKCLCGMEVLKRPSDLVMGKGIKCRHSPPRREVMSDKHVVFRQVKSTANRRDIPFHLSETEVWDLSQGDCYYCGSPPQRGLKTRQGEQRESKWNGLDRLDSNGGYSPGNVVSCCPDCNYGKRRMSVTKFFEWIEKVYTHRKQKGEPHV